MFNLRLKDNKYELQSIYEYGKIVARWLGQLNVPTASLKTGKTPPSNVLDMTLNNLTVRFQ